MALSAGESRPSPQPLRPSPQVHLKEILKCFIIYTHKWLVLITELQHYVFLAVSWLFDKPRSSALFILKIIPACNGKIDSYLAIYIILSPLQQKTTKERQCRQTRSGLETEKLPTVKLRRIHSPLQTQKVQINVGNGSFISFLFYSFIPVHWSLRSAGIDC